MYEAGFWMVCTLKRVRHWKPGSAMGNTRDRRKADCRAHVSSERTGSAGWIHCAETDDFTVSDTGRGINAARDGANALETETADGLFDSITSLQVQGRKALRLVRTLWDLDSGEEFVLSSLMEASAPYLEREKCEKRGWRKDIVSNCGRSLSSVTAAAGR